MNYQPAQQKGFLLLDTLAGMALVMILAMVVGTTLAQTGKGVNALADQRTAVREAERVLGELQQGKLSRNQVKRLDASAPDGMAWIQVEVTVHSQHAQLIGLAPLAAVEGRP